MGTYERRIQAPEKSLNADWVPEEGELFKNGANLYMGDNTTASNALTPINGGGSAQAPVGLPYTFSTATSASGISNGQVRINNVLPGSATTMWIAQTDDSTQDRGTVLNTLSAGGLVYVNTAGDDGSVGVFRVKAMVDSGTYYTLTVDNFSGALPNDGAEVRVTIAPVEVTGVKRYVALLTQTGTNAPVATVLENSLGGTVVWTYDGVGGYSGTLSGAFPENKTWISIPRSCLGADSNISSVVGIRFSDNVISLTSGNPSNQEPSNDVMNNWPIEIRVYP